MIEGLHCLSYFIKEKERGLKAGTMEVGNCGWINLCRGTSRRSSQKDWKLIDKKEGVEDQEGDEWLKSWIWNN